jgi:hypothetical protein
MAVKVPEVLRTKGEAFDRALARPMLIRTEDQWKEEAYAEAEQPEAVGAVLVETLHPHLINAAVGYLYRKEMARNGAEVWAKASKVGGKLAHYTHLDFLIEVNWSRWLMLSDERRIALIDHELMHCGYDGEHDRYVLVPHDLEEFNAIARRWGSWRPSMAHFATALGEGAQLALFTHD